MVTLMAMMVSTTAQSSKRGADLYFQEQAHLLAKSATEHALLAISGHDRAGGTCVNQINSSYDGGIYTITTNIRYIGLGGLGGCNQYTGAGAIATPESIGTVLIDVYVTLNAAAVNIPEDIRFHRRTMQKP